MAFVPMVSSSPPPMMPDDDDFDGDAPPDEFDEFGNFANNDTSYDLTGLSDKLHSIPKEAILVAPKDVERTSPKPEQVDKVESSTAKPINGLCVRGNSPPYEPDGKSDHGEDDDLDVHKKAPTKEDDSEIQKDDDSEIQKDDDSEIQKDNHWEIQKDDDSDIQKDNDSKIQKDDDSEIQKDEEDSLETEDEVAPKVEQDDASDSLDLPEVPCPGQSNELNEDLVGVSSEIDSHCDKEMPEVEEEDDFGDFDSATYQSDPCQSVHEEGEHVTSSDVPAIPDLANDDEDDFGDFDSAQQLDEASGSVPFAVDWSTSSSPRTQLDQNMNALQEKLPAVITSLYGDNLHSENEAVFSPLDMEPMEKERQNVWQQVFNVQSTPALCLSWKGTTAYTQLMALLNIDPNNTMYEGKPPKTSRMVASGGGGIGSGVPAFASGLGMMLEPTKAERQTESLSSSSSTTLSAVDNNGNKEIENERVQETAPPGEFDTNSSDPFDTNVTAFQKKLASVDIAAALAPSNVGNVSRQTGSVTSSILQHFKEQAVHHSSSILQPSSQSESNKSSSADHNATTKKKNTSREVSTILDSFPLLDFMQSPVLMFPPLQTTDET